MAEDLIIPGSGNPEFVLGELAKSFNARQTAYRVVVPPSTGQAGAVRDVSEGLTALGRVGRPLNDAERAKGLSYLPLGREAVAVASGADVQVRGVSSEQLIAIFAGKVTDWSELGGQRAPIRAISKESSDAIRRQLTGRYKDLFYADSVKIVHLDPYLLELLDRYPTSFAIINRSALSVCKTKVRTLALDGVEPTLDNLVNGRYPITMEFGLVHRSGKLSPAARAFVDFVFSPEGAGVLRANGVLASTAGR